MSHRIPARASTETPIERIFEKVMRRKMTAEEREVFHLKTGRDLDVGKSSNGAGLHRKNRANGADSAKLTSL